MPCTISNQWDCHVHVFDPARFPFRSDRAYTPSPAAIDEFLKESSCDGIVLVQASPEDGEEGIVAQLIEASTKYPSKSFRASILSENTPGRDVTQFTKRYIDSLHKHGVRSVRVQGNYNSFGSELGRVKAYISILAKSYPVLKHGWAISMQMPLAVWASLHDMLANLDDHEPRLTYLIAEHNACASPSDLDSPHFQSFLALLRTGRIYVKISALYRRAPGDFRQMQHVVQALAQAAPDKILFGSDWPHIDASKGGLETTPNGTGANWNEELSAIREWLSEEQFVNMMVRNPVRLYA